MLSNKVESKTLNWGDTTTLSKPTNTPSKSFLLALAARTIICPKC